MDHWLDIDHSLDQKYAYCQRVSKTGTLVAPTTGSAPVVPVGTGPGKRTGRKIMMRRFKGSGYITVAVASGNYPRGNLIALTLVYDKGNNATYPPSADFFPNNLAWCSFNDDPERFIILKHLICCTQPYTNSGASTFGSSGGDVNIPFHFEVEMNLPVIYNNTGTGDTDNIISGLLSVYHRCVETTASRMSFEYSLDYVDA